MDSLATFVVKISEKFKMISTSTVSWIQSRLWRDRIQLPVDVEIIPNFFPEIFTTKVMRLYTLSVNSGVTKFLRVEIIL